MQKRFIAKSAAAAAAALALGLSVTGSAAAATSTAKDEAHDVNDYHGSDPKSPYQSAVDILSVKTAAAAKTVKVTVKIGDVRKTTDAYGQKFSLTLYAFKSEPSGFIVSPDSQVMLFSQDQDLYHDETETCWGDLTKKSGTQTDVSDSVKCVENVKTDTVTFTVPTSLYSGDAKWVMASVSAAATLGKDGSAGHYWTENANDMARGPVTKVG